MLIAATLLALAPAHAGAAVEPYITPYSLECHPDRYEGRLLTLDGTIVPGIRSWAAWSLTNMKVSVGNGVDLRFAAPSVVDAFRGTRYVPRVDDYLVGGCDVAATGIFTEDPEEVGHFIFVVLSLVPVPERGR